MGSDAGRVLVFAIVLVGILASLLGWVSLFGIVSSPVEADNVTVTLRVNNVPPTVSAVSVNDNAASLTLTEGTYVTVECNGTLNDTNGYADITNATANFFAINYNETAPFSNRTHYRNDSCSVINSSASSTVAYATCTFGVWFYALNTTWICNLTAADYDGVLNNSNDSILINDLISLDVNSSIDYGTLNPLGTGQNRTTVVNTGNVQIDIGLYGYAWYELDNVSFNCTGGNKNISIDLHRYNLTENGTWAAEMINLTSRQVNATSFDLPPRNDSVNSTKNVFWAVQVPTGVKGNCTGTVVYNTFIG
ncbi:hypothetical protein HY501_02550 [Candidatus Woesearchaeota archaeon]|nr:hypothetical protein [Candidatus Woesearchaeota archaeon]